MAKRRKRIVKPKYVTKEERKKLSKKPMPRELKIGLLFCGAALALAIILFAVFYRGDNLPVKNGEVVVGGDNWIVTNLSETSAKRYYKLGEVNAIEGFTVDLDQSVKSDTNEKDYRFSPDDETSQINHYYIIGVAKPSMQIADEAWSNYAAMYGEEAVSAVKSATIGGHEATYFSAVTVEAESDEGKTTQTLCVYLPAIRGASILISVMLDVTEEMPALTEAELLDFAERVAEGITVEQSK